MTAPAPEIALLISRVEGAADHGDMPAPALNLLSEVAESLSALVTERDQAMNRSVADREWALDWQRAVIMESTLRAEAADALAAVTAERDQARQMLADAPHGDFCNQPEQPCRCWKAGL